MLDPSPREVILPEPISLSSTSVQQASLDFNQSATPAFQSLEIPQGKSGPHNTDEGPKLHEGDFLEVDDLSEINDLVNINDLVSQEPTLLHTEKSGETLGLDHFVGLSDFDVYQDAAMFLREMVPVGQDTVLHANTVGFQLQSRSLMNQVDYQLQPHSAVNNVDSLQPQAFGADQLWVDDQRSNIHTPTEPIHGTLSQPTPGTNESEFHCEHICSHFPLGLLFH